MLRTSDYRQRVADVEFPHQVEMEFKAGDFKFRCRWPHPKVESMHAVVFPQAKALDGTVSDVEQRRQVWIISVSQEQAVARHEVDQALERGLDRRQVFTNVRVID